ncbi:MAG: ABC transporter permease [Thermofilaceae archaeon]
MFFSSSQFRYYIAKRLALLFAYIFCALTLVFFIVNSMPGDPAYSLAVYYMQVYNLKFEDALEMARRALGYDVLKPVHIRYVEYILNLLRGNLGFSLFYKRPAIDVIAVSLPWTLFILTLATILGYFMGTRLGVLAAYRRGSKSDVIIYTVSVVLLSLPPFIFAIIILYSLGVGMRILPIGGAYPVWTTPGFNFDFIVGILWHAVGPVVAQALAQLAGWSIGARNVSVVVLAEDYVKYGVARGLKKSTLRKKYVWRPARLPILTGLALSFGYMLGGSTLVESVFRYPGMGFQLAQAMAYRDFGLIMAIFTIIIFTVLSASFIIELLYPFLDPRVRTE